jgi:hypoxanthine phosphoribosyltransferase
MRDSIRLHDKTFVPFLSEQEVQEKVTQLAAEIDTQFKGRSPLFIAVLNGAFIFAADLLKRLSIECAITFVKLRSYSGTQTSGQVNRIIGLEEGISGRHVIVLEDIVDTGRTMAWLLPELAAQDPLSVTVVALFSKTEAREVGVQVDLVGFEIPKKFIVGYGLDYDGLGRNLRDVYVLAG